MIQRFFEDLGKLNLEFNFKIYQILNSESINALLIKKVRENELEMETLCKYPINVVVKNCIEGNDKKRFMLQNDVILDIPIIEYILIKTGDLVNSKLYDFEQSDDISLFEVKLIDSKIKQINFVLNKKFKSLGVRFSEYIGYFGKSKKGTINYICDFSLKNLRFIKNNGIFDAKLYEGVINKMR